MQYFISSRFILLTIKTVNKWFYSMNIIVVYNMNKTVKFRDYKNQKMRQFLKWTVDRYTNLK